MIYGSWDMERNRQNFFVILDHFLPSYLPEQSVKSKFWKNEKKACRYNFTHVYHKLSITFIWCMVPEIWSATDRTFCNVGSFFVLWPNQQPKNLKLKKKWKKCLEISSFYTSAPKIMIIYYTIPEVWHVIDIIFISNFGLFSALLTP